MDENDIEVLPDGRIALILHEGKLGRGMSTHEVKKAFLAAVRTAPRLGANLILTDAARISEYTKRLELK